MNMPILTQFGNSEQSMTSLEISELVNSEHPHVRTSIERLAKRGVIHKNKAANLKSKLTKHVAKL